MPKTADFLEHGLRAFRFSHLNKVADNSRPNAYAFLFGENLREAFKTQGKLPMYLDRRAFGLEDVPAEWDYDEMCRRYLDNESFIMSEFRAAGAQSIVLKMLRLYNDAERVVSLRDNF